MSLNIEWVNQLLDSYNEMLYNSENEGRAACIIWK